MTVHDEDVDTLRVEGAGLNGLREAVGPIDCGNSGTTLRLLAGLLAGQEGSFELTGDDSLRRRPVDRIAAPLGEMGARLEAEDGKPPLRIEGAPLHGISYELPVASAQVKSAVLLAGLWAEGQHLRDRAGADARPHRDHARRRRRSHPAATRPRVGRARRAPDARRGRGARRLLRGRAVHRGGDAPHRLGGHGPRRRPQPDPNRAPRRARTDGRADHDLQPAAKPRRRAHRRHPRAVGASSSRPPCRPRRCRG